MPVKMALWRLDGDKSIPVPSSSLDTEKRLEDILENDIGILGLGPLLVVGRQVPTRFGKYIDLLALGSDGDVYVIELKRDRTAREVAAQALDYGSWVRELAYDDFTELFATYTGGKDFDDAQQEAFDELPESLNGGHHLVIVASELDPSTERILDYLNDFEVPNNVVFFRYMKDEGNEYLARSWLVDPDQVETRTAKKKPPWNERDFYVAFGEGEHGARLWEDALRVGFISGGGKKWYSRSLFALQPGHRVFVYIPSPTRGYVGVGRVVESAQPVDTFLIKTETGELPILEAPGLLAPNIGHNLNDPDKIDRCEYFVRVEWMQTHARSEAYWEPGFFANQNTAAKFRDTKTLKHLEEHFGVAEEES
jgi:hypothetical protein